MPSLTLRNRSLTSLAPLLHEQVHHMLNKLLRKNGLRPSRRTSNRTAARSSRRSRRSLLLESLEGRRMLTTTLEVVSSGTNEIALPDFDETAGTLQQAQVDVSVASANTGAAVIPNIEHGHGFVLAANGGGASGGGQFQIGTSAANIGDHSHTIPSTTIGVQLWNNTSTNRVAPIQLLDEISAELYGQNHTHGLPNLTFETLGGTYTALSGGTPFSYGVGGGTATNGIFVPKRNGANQVLFGTLTVRISATSTQSASAGDFTHTHSITTNTGIFNSSGSINSVNPTGNSNHSHALNVDVDSRSFTDLAELATYFADGSTTPVSVGIGTSLGHTHALPSLSTTTTTTFTYDAVPVGVTDGPYLANEGDTVRFDASGSSDDVGIASYQWDFDFDGSFSVDASGPVAFQSLNDDFASRTVALRVVDTLGQETIETTTLTVNGVAPWVAASNAQSSLPGVTTAFDLGSFTDPGNDGPFDVSVDWGDGTPTTEFILPAAGPIGTRTHAYTTAGDYSISVDVTDADTQTGSATTSVAVNNLPAANVSVTSNSVSEDVGSVTIQVDLDSPATGQVMIPLQFSGTALEVSDYTAADLSIVIDDGESTGSTLITITDDVLSEDTEDVIVTLGTPIGARIGDDSVQAINIVDNDALPTVSFTESIQTGSEGSSLMISARLSAIAGRDITVPLAFSGSATRDVDYFADNGGSLVIPSGQQSASVQLGILDDNLGEANELAILTMGVPNGAVLSNAPGDTTQHTIRIPVSDTPTVGFVSANQGLFEATENFQVVVNLSGPSTETVTVELNKPATDTPAATETLTFAPGEITQVRPYSIDDDSMNEPDENLTFSLGASVNAIPGSSTNHIVTVKNDDVSIVSVDPSSIEVFEDAGQVTFAVSLSQPVGSDITVPVSFDGSAKLSNDFYSATMTVIIPAGQSSGTGSFELVNDGVRENSEQLFVRLGDPGAPAVVLGSDRAFAVSILDNDPEVGFSAEVRRVGEDSGTIAVRANLSTATNVDVVVPVQVLPGSAKPSFLPFPFASQDLISPSVFTITIPAGSRSGTSSPITIVDDSREESTETFALQILPTANANSATSVSGLSTFQTIRVVDNDDPIPTISLSASEPTVVEAGQVAVDVDIELSSASTTDISVPLSYFGTATENVDFVGPGTVNVVAGSRSATATITILDDNIRNEGDESIGVRVGGGLSLTTFKSGVGVSLTLRDDDRSSSVPRKNNVKPSAATANQSNTLSPPMTLAVTAELGDGVDLSAQDLSGLSNPDPSLNAADNQSFFGASVVAIGGAFAGSTLFFDSNFNGLLDIGEPSTVTAFDATAQLTIPDSFDLNDDAVLDVTEGQLVLAGGIDTATDVPLELRLTAPAGYFAVSMMSTLVNGLVQDHGLSLADAEDRVLEAMGLPDVNLHSLNIVQEAAAGNANAAAVFAELVELEDTVVPIANLIAGIDGAPGIDVVGGLIFADIAAKISDAGSLLDLTIPGNVNSLVEGTLFATGLSLGGATVDGVSQIIGESNARIRSVPVNASAACLKDVARIQTIMQGAFADDMQSFASSGAMIADIVAEYTGSLMGGKIAASTPGNVVTPLLFIDDVVRNEGDSGTVTYDFTVFLVNEPSSPVSVDWATADDTSKASDGDYQSATGQLTWDAGDTSPRTISVTANSDFVYEPDESFKVVLSNPMNAALRREIGYGFLLNEEPIQIASDGSSDSEFTAALTASSYEISQNGEVLFEASTTTAQQINIDGSDNVDDSLMLDFAASTFRSDHIQFDGRSGSGIDGASVVGGFFQTINIQVIGTGSGETLFSPANSPESVRLDWAGLESFTFEPGGVDDLLIDLPVHVTSAVLEDADLGDSQFPGMMQLVSGNDEFAPLVFLNPFNSLTIRGGNGNGAIVVGQLDSAFGGTLLVESTDAVDDVAGHVVVGEDDGVTDITAAILANDSDPQGDSFSVTKISDGITTVSTAAPGSLTLTNGSSVSIDSIGAVWFDPNGHFESLAAGSNDATSSFQYQITDASGAIDTALATVVVTGQNDAPIALGFSGNANEEGPSTTVTVDHSDVDASDTHTFSLDTTGTLGSVVNNGNGMFVYDPNDAFESLADGETAVDTFAYTVDDGNGGTSTAAVTVTITGQNDAPVAVDVTGSIIEGGPSTTISADYSDLDASDLHTFIVDTIGTLGSVTNNSDGTFTYDPDGAFEALAAGESATDTFTYTVDDGNGGLSTASVSVGFTGENDAPVAVSLIAAASEDGPSTTISADYSDVDASDIHTFSVDTTGTLGSVINNADGTFSYNPNGAFEFLADGESASDSFTYTVDDGNGGTSKAAVSVSITGQNDAPAAVDVTGSIIEGGPSKTISAEYSDLDASDSHTFSVDTAGTLGSVTNNSDGTFTYDPKGAFDSLAAGESATDTFTYTVEDGNGGTRTANVSVAITGTNDAPIAMDVVGTASEDGATITILANSVDVDTSDAHTFSIDTSGTLGSVVNNGDGILIYDPAGAFESLAVGATATDTFTYTVEDGNGGSSTAMVTVTIGGVNDDASISGISIGATNEDAIVAVTGTLAVSDIDEGESSFAPLSDTGGYGSFSIDANGDWTYLLDNAAVQDLNADDSVADSFTVTSFDGTASETVVITIGGLNDAAEIDGIAIGSTDEDAVNEVSGSLSVSDVDEGEATIAPLIETGSYGSFNIDGNGDWTYVLDNASVEELNIGDSLTDSFSVTSYDGTAAETVAITIDGLNDAASISGVATGSIDEDATSSVIGTLTVSDVDGGQSVFMPFSESGSYGSFSIDANGGWSYTVDNALVQYLSVGEAITDEFSVESLDGTASVAVVVTIDGETDAPVIETLESSSPRIDGAAADDVVTVSGTFTDVDASDVHSVTVDWGDGSDPEAISVDQDLKTFEGVHEYESGGVYDVSVTVDDSNGGATTKTTQAVTGGIGVVDGILRVIGTDGKDKVTVKRDWVHDGSGKWWNPKNWDEMIHVYGKLGHQSFSQHFDPAEVAAIHIVTFGESDTIKVGYGVDLPVAVDAGSGNDDVTIRSGDATVQAGDGRDRVTTGPGNDRIDGGSGRDFISTGGGNDTIIDLDGDNQIWSGSGDDVVQTGDGNDFVWLGGGADTAQLGGGNDRAYGGFGNDIILAGAGDDRVDGGWGNDLIVGDSGDDRIWGWKGDDVLIGGTGKDRIRGNDGRDLLIGGSAANGDDLESLDSALASWTSQDQASTLNFLGWIGDDEEKDRLDGDRGDDEIFAGLSDRIND